MNVDDTVKMYITEILYDWRIIRNQVIPHVRGKILVHVGDKVRDNTWDSISRHIWNQVNEYNEGD